jgi:SAM-dependent methyltransferase
VIVRSTEGGQTWAELAKLDSLASVLDPADRRGQKNRLIDKVHKRALGRAVGDVRERIALDFGCGTGRLSDWLVRRGARVEGVDITPEMVEVARKRVPEAQFKTIEGPTLPFPDERFDLVITAYVLQYYLRQDLIARELVRVLRTGGSLMAVEQVADEDIGRGGSVDIYQDMLRRNGLRVLDASPIRMSDSRIMAIAVRLPVFARLPILPGLITMEAKVRERASLTNGRYADVIFSATKAPA